MPYEIAGVMSAAVDAAARDAEAADVAEPVVLLSPACASFDQYPNFEVRGKAFTDLVRALPGIENARRRRPVIRPLASIFQFTGERMARV